MDQNIAGSRAQATFSQPFGAPKARLLRARSAPWVAATSSPSLRTKRKQRSSRRLRQDAGSGNVYTNSNRASASNISLLDETPAENEESLEDMRKSRKDKRHAYIFYREASADLSDTSIDGGDGDLNESTASLSRNKESSEIEFPNIVMVKSTGFSHASLMIRRHGRKETGARSKSSRAPLAVSWADDLGPFFGGGDGQIDPFADKDSDDDESIIAFQTVSSRDNEPMDTNASNGQGIENAESKSNPNLASVQKEEQETNPSEKTDQRPASSKTVGESALTNSQPQVHEIVSAGNTDEPQSRPKTAPRPPTAPRAPPAAEPETAQTSDLDQSKNSPKRSSRDLMRKRHSAYPSSQSRVDLEQQHDRRSHSAFVTERNVMYLDIGIETLDGTILETISQTHMRNYWRHHASPSNNIAQNDSSSMSYEKRRSPSPNRYDGLPRNEHKTNQHEHTLQELLAIQTMYTEDQVRQMLETMSAEERQHLFFASNWSSDNNHKRTDDSTRIYPNKQQTERAEKRALKLRVSSAFCKIPSAKKTRVPWSPNETVDDRRTIKPNRNTADQGQKVSVVNLGRNIGVNNINLHVPRIVHSGKMVPQETNPIHFPKIEYEPVDGQKIGDGSSVQVDVEYHAHHPPESRPVSKRAFNTNLAKNVHAKPQSAHFSRLSMGNVQISSAETIMSVVGNGSSANKQQKDDIFDNLGIDIEMFSPDDSSHVPPNSARAAYHNRLERVHGSFDDSDDQVPQQSVHFSELHLQIKNPRPKTTTAAVIFERLIDKTYEYQQEALLPVIGLSPGIETARNAPKSAPGDPSRKKAKHIEAPVAVNMLQLPVSERTARMPAHIAKLKNAAKLSGLAGTPNRSKSATKTSSQSTTSSAVVGPRMRKGMWVVASAPKSKRSRKKTSSGAQESEHADQNQLSHQDPKQSASQNALKPPVKMIAQAWVKPKSGDAKHKSAQRPAPHSYLRKQINANRTSAQTNNVAINNNVDSGPLPVPPSLIASIVHDNSSSSMGKNSSYASSMTSRYRERPSQLNGGLPMVPNQRRYYSFASLPSRGFVQNNQSLPSVPFRNASEGNVGSGVPLDANTPMSQSAASGFAASTSTRTGGAVGSETRVDYWIQQTSTDQMQSSLSSIPPPPPYDLFRSSSSRKSARIKPLAPFMHEGSDPIKPSKPVSRVSLHMQSSAAEASAQETSVNLSRSSLFGSKNADRKFVSETPGPWT